MKEQSIISLRAHTQILKRPKRRKRAKERGSADKPSRQHVKAAWPSVLVIDCETTLDECQALTFGSYRYCRLLNGAYVCVQEGFFHADDLQETDPEGLSRLRQYAESHDAETPDGFPKKIEVISRTDFMYRTFWQAVYMAGAMVVGLNIPFDLSRLAGDSRVARGRNRGWSLIMFQDNDPMTGRQREDPLKPRIIIEPKDSKTAFIKFAGVSIRSKRTGKRLVPYNPGRFLDLRTLGWALRNESYGLQSACTAFGVPGKLDHEPTGQVSDGEVEYCRQDLRATVNLLNAMRLEFQKHQLDLAPESAFSPASIAKAYLKKMGVVPPPEKFSTPDRVSGAAMQAYYGGRAECHIRHTVVPVVHTDLMSEYPTVNTLMGLWSFLIAEHLTMDEATEEVRILLDNLKVDDVFNQKFWKNLTFYALVRPEDDVLPVRTTYDNKSTNIGINRLTSDKPIWYAGPDLVAATLLTGRPPAIIQAVKVVPQGQQSDLRPVSLRGMVEIDPRTDDFFKAVIESRARVKSDRSLPESDRDALRYLLKILANAGSYGLFVEVNPENLARKEEAVAPPRARLRVFSGENVFEQTSTVVENQGVWYCPSVAALITAGGRLLLALLERVVTDAGGTYLLCDTDSMSIVASETGGLEPCAGGPYRLPDGTEAIKALSWADVRGIVERFEQLNPYDRNAVRDPILKIEDVNLRDGTQEQLFGYAIAAKRYVLFTRTADGGIQVEKASAHGLGFLYPPKHGFNSRVKAPEWVVEAWEWILRDVYGLTQEAPSWFDLPAMMRFTITTPQVMKVLQARQKHLPHRDRVKPYNFIQSPVIDHVNGHPVGADPNRLTLIAAFTSEPSRWCKRPYVNVHDGKQYRLGQPGKRLPYEAEPKTYGQFVSQYRWHPEAKSLAPDWSACDARTRGLLRRTQVNAVDFRYIGKETDRRWEQGEDLSILDPNLLEYRAGETARLVTDPKLQHDACLVPIRVLSKESKMTEKTVKEVRRGKRIRKSTAKKIRAALDRLLRKSRDSKSSTRPGVSTQHAQPDLPKSRRVRVLDLFTSEELKGLKRLLMTPVDDRTYCADCDYFGCAEVGRHLGPLLVQNGQVFFEVEHLRENPKLLAKRRKQTDAWYRWFHRWERGRAASDRLYPSAVGINDDRTQT